MGQPAPNKSKHNLEILNEIEEESSYEKSIDKQFVRKFDNLHNYHLENEVDEDENAFSAIIKQIEDENTKSIKSTRVSSFSPVATYKTSLGSYYEQHPDSSETRVKNKPMTYFSKKNLNSGH